MQVLFVVLTLVLLAVALFALQNPDPVTVRFLYWEVQASVAVVTLAAASAGALVAALLGTVSRLRRWSRARAEARPGQDAAAGAPGPGSPPPPSAP